jgi:hypothetical protein
VSAEQEHSSPLYGIVAEFDSVGAILDAARHVREAGYRDAEAYTPFPVQGLSQALGFGKSWVAMLVLAGAIVGCSGAFFMQWYANVVSYPWNIGGRPPNSWPAWIPITFELSVLCAALAAVIGMLALNRLPQPSHPLFNVPEFQLATRDRFFLCIEASDPKFDLAATRQFLEQFSPLRVREVPR